MGGRAEEGLEGTALSCINYPSPSEGLQDCLLRAGTCIIAGPVRKADRPARRRRRASLVRREAPDQRGLLERILDTPHLAQAVPRLQPELLHRIIQRCGLEDCSELVALATPEQLAAVFDRDLWHGDRPGLDEQLDARRFGLWLEVLLESGAAVAAEKLLGLDVDLVSGALAQHVRVFDHASVSPFPTLDGEQASPYRRPDSTTSCEVGPFLIEARLTDSWDPIVTLLRFLDAEHPDYFRRVMAGCRAVSNSAPEVDGLHDLLADGDQDLFDLASDREQRREHQGYATPAQARAFLEMARHVQRGHAAAPPPNPIAAAYFRETKWPAPLTSPPSPPSDHASEPVAAIVEVLREAGVLPQQPRALLRGSHDDAPRLARIQAQMQAVHDRDQASYSTRMEELAFLANTLLAGCPLQARAFTPREASDAAVAVCNLGLQNWFAGTMLPDDFLLAHDLVSVFQVGWTTLHDDVCRFAAEQLIDVLADLRSEDGDIQARLDSLRVHMSRHSRDGAPWRARDALDVIVMLDMPAWATLVGLIAECPVIHAAIGASLGLRMQSVSADAFEFISDNSQIAEVREFMRVLPDTLRG